MRSARRRKLIEREKNAVKSAKSVGFILKFVFPILLIFIIFIFFKLTTKYWNGEDKFIFSYRLESGDVAVDVFDPKMGEATSLIIPGDTQVDVARNYGELRIKNVWQLGVNEKIGGELLSETVTQNFMFPVFLWSDADAKSLTDANLLNVLRFIFFPKSTNIPFGDRVMVSLFALKVGNTGLNSLDLGKNQFLVKQKLNDGVVGYLLAGPISTRLTMYFSDNLFADKNLRVVIMDATGIPGVSEKVGQIVEVMGGKIVSVEKKDTLAEDCTVFGSDKAVVKKIAAVFSCKVSGEKGEMDIEIDLGSFFAKRF